MPSKVLPGLLKSATAGAWFFAVGSLITLVVLIASGWPGAHATMASTTTGGKTYNAIGLTYPGAIGAVWLWSQACIVFAAIVLSVLPGNRLRRIGHVILVAWSALWFANAVWLPALDGAWVVASVLGALFGSLFLCTLIRATRLLLLDNKPPADGADPA